MDFVTNIEEIRKRAAGIVKKAQSPKGIAGPEAGHIDSTISWRQASTRRRLPKNLWGMLGRNRPMPMSSRGELSSGEASLNSIPSVIAEHSHSEYREGTSLADMIREDLIAERIAIETYREMVRYFGDKDTTSRVMLEEHADELADLLFAVQPDTNQGSRRPYSSDETPERNQSDRDDATSDGSTGIKHKEEVFMAKRSNQNNEDLSEQESVNALELLKKDHRKVEQLFQSFEEADGRSRQGIADEAIKAIEVHAKIEETLVYPAIREGTGEEDLVDEANEEHHVVTLLIKELKKMKASAEGYKAKFTVMSELVKHHIEEEEKEMFPEAENADIDWEELGQEAMSIKERMMSKSSRGHRRAA